MQVRRAAVWVTFLAVSMVIFIALFIGWGILEAAALADPEGLTLSQFVVNLVRAWPPIVVVVCAIIFFPMGLLTTHFLWPWMPAHMRAICGQCGKTILLTGEPK